MNRGLSHHGQKTYNQLQLSVAKTHQAREATSEFSVEPAAAQLLNDQIAAKADFLTRINLVPVTGLTGERVLLGISGPVSSRTNTDTTDRKTTDFSSLKGEPYELKNTETDIGISFAKIDAWAKFKDFNERYQAAVQKQIAQDRMMVGFHGTHAAPQTDVVAFPNLEDVNKGWLQQAREQIPAQVLTGSPIEIGSSGDYPNLDALVLKVKRLIAPKYRAAGDLVAIIGSDLLDAEQAKLYAKQGDNPSEKERIDGAQVVTTYGGLPTFSVPFFPVDAVLVTSWENLSIYFHESSWGRQLIENSRRSRVEDYNHRNEGYVIEHLEKIALAENITHMV
jgi:P2 family phage major capsid protein